MAEPEIDENRSISEKPLLDKLGVRSESRASVLGVYDQEFLALLRTRVVHVASRARKDSNLIFVSIERREDLARLVDLEPSIERSGAIWLVFPKGRKEIREVDVIAAGLSAGLVDNKVVRLSDSHTALRFVVPLSRR